MSTRGSSGMSNGARHGLGAVVGLVLAPVIGGLLAFGVERMIRSFRVFRFEGTDRWIGAAALIAAAIALGIVVGSRISPLASLIPGAAFTLAYLPWLAAPRWSLENLTDALPGALGRGYEVLCVYGILGAVGGALLVASIPPSRWRGLAPAGRPPQPQYGPPPAGQWQPPHQMQGQIPGQPPGQAPGHAPVQPQAGAAGPPPFDPNARPYGPPAPPPAQGEAVPGQIGQPGPPPSEPPAQGPDDDEPGEWTRMYGGKGSREDRPQS